jgi:hypothetical protein
MDGLKKMDKEAFVAEMQRECRRIMEQVADAVNAAPTGNLISGSKDAGARLDGGIASKSF